MNPGRKLIRKEPYSVGEMTLRNYVVKWLAEGYKTHKTYDTTATSFCTRIFWKAILKVQVHVIVEEKWSTMNESEVIKCPKCGEKTKSGPKSPQMSFFLAITGASHWFPVD